MASTKRNAALEAIGAAPKAATPQLVIEAPRQAAAPTPKPSKAVSKVMVYMPAKVARKFKEIAFTADQKANDIYLDALDLYLTQQGHGGIKGGTER